MDGVSRPAGSGVPIEWKDGEVLILDPVTLKDLGVVEQHILSKRPDPIDLALDKIAERGLAEPIAKALFDRAFVAAKAQNVVTREEVGQFIDTREGLAFTIWLSLQKRYGERFKLGDIEVVPSELRARRGDEVIELSLRDVKMLELFHRNKGRALDRNTILNECWGRDYIPSSRTLDQHVSQLRKRIEIDPKNPAIIRTVHGVGYRCDG